MPLAINSQEPSSTGHTSATSPLTWSFTNTAGTVLYVGVATAAPTGTSTATGVTYNSVALTKVGSIPYGATIGTCEVSIWRLLTPATGSNTVSVTASGSGMDDIMAGAISFTGNHATVPEGTPATAKFDTGSGTTSASVTVSGTTSGNYVIAMMDAGSAYSSTSNTLTWHIAGGAQNSPGDNSAMTYQSVSTSSTTMTNTIVQDWWGIIAVEVLPAGGGPAQDTPELYGRPDGLGGQRTMMQLLAQ